MARYDAHPEEEINANLYGQNYGGSIGSSSSSNNNNNSGGGGNNKSKEYHRSSGGSDSFPPELKKLDDKYKDSHGLYAPDAKTLLAYAVNYPEDFPQINYTTITNHWEALKSSRREQLQNFNQSEPNDTFTSFSQTGGSSFQKPYDDNDLNYNSYDNNKNTNTTGRNGDNIFCQYNNSVNGCTNSRCHLPHIKPPICITIYNAPKDVTNPYVLKTFVLKFIQNPNEFIFIHHYPEQNDCFTVEFSSSKSRDIALQCLTSLWSQAHMTKESPQEVYQQFGYSRKSSDQKDNKKTNKSAWEWKNDHGEWIEYPLDISNRLEEAKINDTVNFNKDGRPYSLVKSEKDSGFQANKEGNIREIRRNAGSSSKVEHFDTSRTNFSNTVDTNRMNFNNTMDTSHMSYDKNLISNDMNNDFNRTNQNFGNVRERTDVSFNSDKKFVNNSNYLWECVQDDGSAKPFDRSIAEKIERARIGDIMEIREGDVVYELQKLDVKLGFQVNKNTKKKRLIQRQNLDDQNFDLKNQNDSFNTTKSMTFERFSGSDRDRDRNFTSKYIWEWEDEQNQYHPYEPIFSDQLEAANLHAEIPIKIRNVSYVLIKDGIAKGRQVNTATRNARYIRRRQL